MNRETLLQRHIKKTLESKGYEVFRMPVQPLSHTVNGKTVLKPHPLKGFPDLFGFCKNQRGRLFTVEVKTEAGNLKDEQIWWQGLLFRQGAIHIVGRNPKKVLERLQLLDQPCECL